MNFLVNAGRVFRLALILVLVATLGGSFGACADSEEFVQTRAYKVTSRSQLIGGPKALGNKGDYIIENDRIRVLINGHPTDYSGGVPNKWGGGILDADIQRVENFFEPGTVGKDALVELLPIMDVKTFGYDNIFGSGPVVRVPQDAIEILNDGSEDGAAAIKVSGTIQELISLLRIIPVPLSNLPVKAETIYSLEPGENWLKISTRFTLLNEDGSEPDTLFEVPLQPITDTDNPIGSIVTGDAFGDAVFFGDGVSVIGPNVFGFSSSWFVEDQFNQGNSTFIASPTVPWSAGVNEDIGYALVSEDGPLSFPVIESFLTIAFQQITAPGYQLPTSGATYTYNRYLVIDEGDVAGLLDHMTDIRGWAYGKVRGHVLVEGTDEAASGVQVHVFEHPRFLDDNTLVPMAESFDAMNEFLGSTPREVSYRRLTSFSRFTTDARRTDIVKDGSFAGRIPVDETTGEQNYILMASGPGNTKSRLYAVTVTNGGESNVALVLPATGRLSIEVRDSTLGGTGHPAKLTIQALSGVGLPEPRIGEGYLPENEVKLVHSLDGHAEVELPVGRYRVIASHGPEYSINFKDVDVSAFTTQRVTLDLEHQVDTSGWVAADMHIHTHYSPDSGRSIKSLLGSAMSEGLDMVVGTDHDFIANYVPVMKELGLLGKLAYMGGDELSHFSFAHFNSFPLRYDQSEVSGGAPQWRNPSPSVTLPDGSVMPYFVPQDCFDALRARGDRDVVDQDPIVIVNHGREAFTGYFRAYGWEQFSGKFDSPDFLTLTDPVVNNGEILTKNPQQLFSWDFDALEVMNSKRYQDIRTSTEEDVPETEIAQPSGEGEYFPTLVRTADEQLRISSGDLLFDSSEVGSVDDYFTLTAMNRRVTGIANSDTHSSSSTEAGKCRTYVMSDTDDPGLLDYDQFLTNLKKGRAIATCGPFIETWVNGKPIGSDVRDTDGTISLRIRAQAPEWMSLDRLEIYGNGVLIGEIGADSSDIFLGCDTDGLAVHDNSSAFRFDGSVDCHIDADTAVVVIGIGYEGLAPVSQPVAGPTIEITDSLVLGVNQLIENWFGISNVIPPFTALQRNHDTYPYAMTNAIYVDYDGADSNGDGWVYDGPGFVPGWFDEEEVVAKVKADPKVMTAIAAAKSRLVSMSSVQQSPKNDNTRYWGDEDEDHDKAGCGF
ncbi:PHP domain-containing protein [bacterium]|nr:PHP domain-containing protein [bacterium]